MSYVLSGSARRFGSSRRAIADTRVPLGSCAGVARLTVLAGARYARKDESDATLQAEGERDPLGPTRCVAIVMWTADSCRNYEAAAAVIPTDSTARSRPQLNEATVQSFIAETECHGAPRRAACRPTRPEAFRTGPWSTGASGSVVSHLPSTSRRRGVSASSAPTTVRTTTRPSVRSRRSSAIRPSLHPAQLAFTTGCYTLADLEPTPPLAGDGAPGHRTTSAEGDGLPPSVHAS